MKDIITFALLLLLLLVHKEVHGQDRADSSNIFTFDEYYSTVIHNHPIVKQAQLLTRRAAEEVRLARGNFDPKIAASWSKKEFNDADYYDKFDAYLKIPVWFPVDPKIGYEKNSGTYLNPENFISENTNNRQVYAGVTVPIGRGLFIDQRRATVRQAQVMQEMAEAEQIKAINKILLTAAKDYWEWYFAYYKYELMQQSIGLARDIFSRTKLAFEYGEAAAIDTVQANITLLNRITEFQQADIDRINATLQLSNNLWSAEGEPLELENKVRPEILDLSQLNKTFLTELIEQARNNHPEILKLRLKGQSLDIDRSLARENIKPRLDLSYYLLDQPYNAFGENNSIALDDNYKFGVDFSFPLFLRKERAKINMIKFKINENILEQNFTERVIINSLNSQFNEVVTTAEILQQQQNMVESYQLILNAERLNLESGESDLFKINVQIDKLIEAQSKLIKLQSNYQKDLAELYWAAGLTNLGY